MNARGRVSEIGQLHQELAGMILRQSFDKPLEVPDNLKDPIYVFLTNSGVDRELYQTCSGHRVVQNCLDHNRFQFVRRLLDTENIVLVMGDPRLDEDIEFNFVPYNPSEGPQGEWVHWAKGELYRPHQAEAWLYKVYVDYINARNVKTTRLIFVSAKRRSPYHRVKIPECWAKDIKKPAKKQRIDLPKKSFVFRPPHPKWPGGAVWIPRKLVRAEFDKVPITVYALGIDKHWHTEPGFPHHSARDLWAIENCADLVVAFHNGISSATKWNYEAAVERGIPSILVTFGVPGDLHSKRVDWR